MIAGIPYFHTHTLYWVSDPHGSALSGVAGSGSRSINALKLGRIKKIYENVFNINLDRSPRKQENSIRVADKKLLKKVP